MNEKQNFAVYAGVDYPLDPGATQEDALNALLAFWPALQDNSTCEVQEDDETRKYVYSMQGGTKG